MSFLDVVASRFGYQKITPILKQIEKAESKESYALNPMAIAYQQMGMHQGLRKPSQITLRTLRRMSRSNWVDRTCITTLRDEITSVPWDIIPLDPKKPVSEAFQKYLLRLLKRPNKSRENWRTLIDKVVEDILVLDAGVIEKIRDNGGRIIELYQVDGETIRPLYDKYGQVGDVAYQQFISQELISNADPTKPVAEWSNEDMIYMMWNPQGAIDTFGFGLSPVEAGLAAGTAFLYAEAYNLGFFQRNTIPQMIINMGKDVQPAAIDKFQAFLASEMQGTQGFHQPVIGSFGEGFDIKNISKDPADMAWKEYVEWQMRWKVALYRMSPQDIGFTLDQYKTEGGVQQQLSKNKAINSLKGVLKEYIDTEIIGDPGWGIDFEAANLQFSWIDSPMVSALDQANVDKIYLGSGVYAINDVRRRQGMDPIAGGQKPTIIAGAVALNIDETPVEEDDIEDDTEKSVTKSFSPDEGRIPSLAENQSILVWMDDRGVTQPLFVTDLEKTCGFTVKPIVLDERRKQDPPEGQVSELLRAYGVNTPEVRIMTEEEILALLPINAYPKWNAYISLQQPFDSIKWRERWGDTRKANGYIVTGFITGRDLGNEDLKHEMAQIPEAYGVAVKDFARIWLAEKKFVLGDRKPGHFFVTQSGAGFGVDYTFVGQVDSWKETGGWLPLALKEINPKLYEMFQASLIEIYDDFDRVEKALKLPKGWTPMLTNDDLDKRMMQVVQRKIYNWYKKAVHVSNTPKRLVKKNAEFDTNDSYLTDGVSVYQNGIKYPVSVLDKSPPSADDLLLSPADYRSGYDFGVIRAQNLIEPYKPDDIRVSAPELYAPKFEDRIKYLASNVNASIVKDVTSTISRGLDAGKGYAEIALDIQQTLGVDPNDPLNPLWRAERIARTEAQWAINEGMRDQYKEVGVTSIMISPAPDACDECISAANAGPYSVDQEGILPIHPSCRCEWVGDFSKWE